MGQGPPEQAPNSPTVASTSCPGAQPPTSLLLQTTQEGTSPVRPLSPFPAWWILTHPSCLTHRSEARVTYYVPLPWTPLSQPSDTPNCYATELFLLVMNPSRAGLAWIPHDEILRTSTENQGGPHPSSLSTGWMGTQISQCCLDDTLAPGVESGCLRLTGRKSGFQKTRDLMPKALCLMCGWAGIYVCPTPKLTFFPGTRPLRSRVESSSNSNMQSSSPPLPPHARHRVNPSHLILSNGRMN